jgi:hypothetical protein
MCGKRIESAMDVDVGGERNLRSSSSRDDAVDGGMVVNVNVVVSAHIVVVVVVYCVYMYAALSVVVVVDRE